MSASEASEWKRRKESSLRFWMEHFYFVDVRLRFNLECQRSREPLTYILGRNCGTRNRSFNLSLFPTDRYEWMARPPPRSPWLHPDGSDRGPWQGPSRWILHDPNVRPSKERKGKGVGGGATTTRGISLDDFEMLRFKCHRLATEVQGDDNETHRIGGMLNNSRVIFIRTLNGHSLWRGRKASFIR